MTVLTLFGLLASPLWAREILTNEFRVVDAPSWLTEDMIGVAAGRVQRYLEWNVERIPIRFHSDAASFRKAGGVGPKVKAYFLNTDHTIHVGPEVSASNLKPILAHEVVHVISQQKFGKAIPLWLEEGLANFVGAEEKANRAWLLTQSLPPARSLRHPSTDPFGSKLHYQMSTALIEMISEKCDLTDLLHLAVGASFETYLDTSCGLSDVDGAFRVWLKQAKKKKKKWF